MAAISIDPVARLAERQHWITPAAEIAAQDAIRAAFEPLGSNAEPVRDALHGSWLHQPLHAVLTDVPVGAWTAAVVFDAIAAVTDSEKLDSAAGTLVLLGLVGAAGAAITGLNDWADVKESAPRRIGAVHALLNVASTGLFTASAVFRRKASSRTTARWLAAVGFAVVSVSAHLGGNLVYEHHVGTVANAETEPIPRDPEDRPMHWADESSQREKNHDKTLADSFPTSDPPSSIPDPAGD